MTAGLFRIAAFALLLSWPAALQAQEKTKEEAQPATVTFVIEGMT